MNSHLNIALKIAIVKSGRKQQRIADLACIGRTQLSHIVAGRRLATPDQRATLAVVLGVPEDHLFCPEGRQQLVPHDLLRALADVKGGKSHA